MPACTRSAAGRRRCGFSGCTIPGGAWWWRTRRVTPTRTGRPGRSAGRPIVARRRRRGAALLLRAVLVGLPLTARAAEPCQAPDGGPAPAVAQLVSMVGDVRINDRVPGGGLPF